jgi:hypothetical protein
MAKIETQGTRGIRIPEGFYKAIKTIIVPADQERQGKPLTPGHDPHAGVKAIDVDPETLKSGSYIPGTNIKHEGGLSG